METAAPAKPVHLLVVEDDPSIAMVLEETLRQRHYEVRVANNPEAALQAVKELTPDLALMDINLSADIDGIQTVEKMRETGDIPVCFITAYSDDETIARAEAVGPMAYLVKPFEVSDVTAMVSISLANARRMKARIDEAVKKATAAPPPAAKTEAKPVPASVGLEDKATGLPNRHAAEALFERVEEGGSFVTPLIVDHVPILKQRFGTAALDRILLSYSQHLAQHLPDGCQLCRWNVSAFVIIPPEGSGSELQRELSRVLASPMLYHLQLTGRSALLRISSTFASLNASDGGPLALRVEEHLAKST